jgi:small subunit ribosomal protein S5e
MVEEKKGKTDYANFVVVEPLTEPKEQLSATEHKLFGKWAYKDLFVEDKSLEGYITFQTMKSQVFYPHTAGRYQQRGFRKVACPFIERMVNSLMMHGRNTGKKLMAIKIVKQALEIIHLMTGENPLQVTVKAIENGGVREDSTRIQVGGVIKRQAVDVSPLRRVNQAIYMMCFGSRESSFRKLKTIAECLAEEIMNCAKVFQQLTVRIGISEQLHYQKEGRD